MRLNLNLVLSIKIGKYNLRQVKLVNYCGNCEFLPKSLINDELKNELLRFKCLFLVAIKATWFTHIVLRPTIHFE